jgi:serine/threonine protein kinase
MPSVYDPPEAHQGSRSTASDIWALGVTLFEALTRSPPSGLDERDGALALPPDFSPAFRDVVARCLCRRPHDRPGITEVEGWIRSQSAGATPVTTIQPAGIAESNTYESAPPSVVREQGAPPSAARHPEIPQSIVARTSAAVPVETGFTRESAQRPDIRAVVGQYIAALLPSKWRSLAPAPLILGAVAVLALGWTGVRLLSGHRSPLPPTVTVQTPREAPLQAPKEAPPVTPNPPSYRLAASDTKQGQIERAHPQRQIERAQPSPAGLHEEIPDVPRSARHTIRGHIKVYVRVIVEKDGTVYAALADRPGPSRYFQRLAVESAKKWTFPPVEADAPRLMQVRFDFSRRGTTGHAVTLQQVAARAP